jgi:hypothetical protein
MRLPIKRLTLSGLATLTVALALVPTADATTQRGCPTDAFCIYAQNAYWNNDHPSYIMRPFNLGFSDHQWWNLKNQVGIHKVFNNATPNGGIWVNVWLNRGYNGAGPVLRDIAPGKSYDLDLTKVNSVTLWFYQLTNNY